MALSPPPTIAVLGASGLIGQSVAEALIRDGYRVVAVARRFTPAQRAAFGVGAVEAPFVSFDADRLARLLADHGVDIVLNCVGVLQDGPRGRTRDVHAGFVGRLLAGMQALPGPALLLHLSIPGGADTDATAFSRTKREAEAVIIGSGTACAILRPGFVIAPAAFGGSALIRALAALPFGLDTATEQQPFTATAIGDITATVKAAAELWRGGWPGGAVVWNVMSARASTVGEVMAAFRTRFGGPQPAARLPGWLMSLGALAGDAAAWLGWSPPIRTTALKELRRGVEGDPSGWVAATGIEPTTLEQALAAVPASAQEAWFARLYLLKPMVIGVLSVFWIVSGAVALGPGRHAAVAALAAHAVAPAWAAILTVATALTDVAIGIGVACRCTCRVALIAGAGLALGYAAAASVIAPELWADPLGPLVKIVPALALMAVALAILPER